MMSRVEMTPFIFEDGNIYYTFVILIFSVFKRSNS